ncbi:MAG: nucleoside hydrolase [Firmicutes bacterium]|nr:nucleoside hydrolase [Bacillota bacterium]
MAKTSVRRIILDVDTGIDDAWALIYALRAPTLDVLGITTGFGNADVDTTTRNTLAVTDLLQSRVPVYRGAVKPLCRPWDGPVTSYHGVNGLGNASVPDPLRPPENTEAVDFLHQVLTALPHEVTIVTLARLTNIARLLLYDPHVAPLISRLVIMGGAAFVPGNVTPVAEANIWGDPEAADLVFQSGIPITMVGLDVTHRARLTWDDLDRLDSSLPYAAMMRDATAFYLKAYERDHPEMQGWCPIHDPLAVAVAEDPSLVAVRRYPVRVEHAGRWTTGMTVVDARMGEQPHGIEVALDLNAPAFLHRFWDRVGIAPA